MEGRQMNVCKGLKGEKYILGDKVRDNIYYEVFAVNGNNNIVAKIFRKKNYGIRSNEDYFTEKEEKLKAMTDKKITYRVDGVVRLEWPLDILYKEGEFVGCIVPELISFVSFDKIIYPGINTFGQRKRLSEFYPNYTWKYSVQIAYNLAWTVQYAHSLGIVIGDLSFVNILINPEIGAVSIINCDEFDITDEKSGKRFPCDQCFEDLAAPELQIADEYRDRFSRETDSFSLAVLIFELLMGVHPFSGIASMPVFSHKKICGNVDILEGNCPYVRKCSNVRIPPWAPDFSMLPEGVQNLFRKTFDYTVMTAMKRKKSVLLRRNGVRNLRHWRRRSLIRI